jgi:hypothetical protein
MDFEGQKLAEKLYHWILNGFGVFFGFTFEVEY